jgi:hypothetical protein
MPGEDSLVAFTTERLNSDELNRQGCVRSTQRRLGTWETSQHLLEDGVKPTKP